MKYQAWICKRCKHKNSKTSIQLSRHGELYWSTKNDSCDKCGLIRARKEGKCK